MSTSPRLLVVDDDSEFLEILEQRFRRRGFDVAAHTTCPGALKAADSQRFDAAIVDRSLPGGADLELLTSLNAKDADLPIIVLSGWTGQNYVDEAHAAGARAYLVKPCSLADIEATVGRILDIRTRRLSVGDATT